MGKKTADASLKGKKPIHRGTSKTAITSNPGRIGNKLKRSEMYGKYLMEKKRQKNMARRQRAKEAEALGEEAPEKPTPRTLENTRELEPTLVKPNDEEVAADQADDEFAPYFNDQVRPKILITTRPRPSKQLFYFIADLQRFVPQMHFYPRKSFTVKEICGFAANRGFTHLIVLSEKSKVCNGMTISHLRVHDGHVTAGPTAFFKVSNVITSTDVPNHGSATSHIPELVLNGFGTRLGHRVGRFLGSLFPHNAQFQGRQVATFHNQRDFIFVRHHRYVFEPSKNISKETKQPKTKARLQELGPRFTLKLRWIQEGTFDTMFGEYEWIHKRKEMDTTRRKFHL